MSRRVRLALFALAGPGFGAVLLIGMHGLPSFGHGFSIYARLIDTLELPQRHATDYVTALNFDIRAFDTLGEEFILFASVAGVAVLLRRLRDEREAERSRGIQDHAFAGASAALQFFSLVLVPLLVALGCYVVIHGALTPGGGFQGGLVLAAAPFAILLGGRYMAMKRVAPEWVLEAGESLGAAGYTLIGVAGLIITGVYLKNFLPGGSPAKLLSAGMMPFNSIAVGLEVAGAFLLVWTEFLDQALIVRRDEL